MKKVAKIILGLVTLLPLVYMIFFFITMFSQVFLTLQEGAASSTEPPQIFLVIVGLHFLMMILMFILLIIYIINVFKNDKAAQDKKTLWAVVLFLGNMIAMPIYWYLYIWREPAPKRSERSERSPEEPELRLGDEG